MNIIKPIQKEISQTSNIKKTSSSSSQRMSQALSSNETSHGSSSPLNIIVLYPDDWRHDDIGGVAPVVRTPFLNLLASDGIRFTHNAVTTSICWISRATYFTGQYVSRHASTYLFKPLFATKNWNTTWPYMLQQHGYYIGHIGKWQFWDVDYQKKIFDWSRYHEGRHWYGNKHACDRAKEDAFAFLKQRPKDKPFALTIAFYPPKAVGTDKEPGAQWMPSEEYKKLYENETIPPLPYDIKEAVDALPYFFPKDRGLGRGRWKERWVTEEHYQVGMKNYYALISHVDAACKEIVEKVKELGLYENTMIIFTTDNGLMHGSHGLAGKWYPFEESIRVPLIIYDPRIPAEKRGTLDDSLTLNIDLAETILGAANITPAPLMQGRDIADLYLRPPEQNKSEDWRDEFFYEYPIGELPYDPRVTALVRKDFKFVLWPEKNYQQLFDLVDDPYELHDVVSDFIGKNLTLLKELNDSSIDIRQLELMEKYAERLKEMKLRHDELKLKVMEPIVPGSKCDPLWTKDAKIPDDAPDCITSKQES